jgi:DNA topoisomerase III
VTTVVVAEKPSVARDIADVLGARTRRQGYMEGGGFVVTWAIGHLVGLAEPHQIDPAWKRWRSSDLPLLPREFPLVVVPETQDQFEIVARLLRGRDVREIVCATDAGREGELIFRYIYEAARATKPVKRLWISSLTHAAIRDGFRRLQEQRAFHRLADAARARSRADWLVGMNLSRFYSLSRDEHLSVGRVQTPTLAMLVARELEIRAFVPEAYLEVVATFAPPDRDLPTYRGTYRAEGGRLANDREVAEEIARRAKIAKIGTAKRDVKRIPPPFLYDLTELQRHANRLFGFTAQRTLAIAQSLYEQRKAITYPRTDSRHLSTAVAETLPAVVRAIEAPYRELLAERTGTRALGPRFVDDARVTDHHAILPTETVPRDLSPDERKIYDLVCRRLLSAWHADHVFAVTNVTTNVLHDDGVDVYASSGTSIESQGWKVLDLGTRTPADLPAGLVPGLERRVTEAKILEKTTRAPPRFSDATLLTAMENAGATLEEKELSRAMRERGLGTAATRAAIVETLVRRGYVVRDGKTLAATDKGIALVDAVHPHVKSPAMTGEWEAKLARIERGEGDLPTFMLEIERYVREVVGSEPPPPPRVRESPRPRDLDELLRTTFGFDAFRPMQREVCSAVASGRDALLVMPTGAGKSLCFQLPGLARGGTTLVVSPLIALMEDQVAQLRKRGLAAERIHSGRARADAREVCRAYLDGSLDFLFIAPERLKVSGFPEMLARRTPALVAVDEAHCISHWGHDFRPDYRMLGERLPALRPAPILALTATATADVQNDIVRELRLEAPARFVSGFRRTNIAVEIVQQSASERANTVERLLSDPARRPAIVYAPARAEAEQLARRLGAEAYHAGLAPAVRDRVQSAFVSGELSIIVATIAFGMGIDKPDVRTVIHTALPSTVEGYYQEIGRAGRDGAPSRALLLHSFVDTKMHVFFHERDYPEPDVLDAVRRAIGRTPKPLSEVRRRAGLDEDVVEKALEKLWIHGGVLRSGEMFSPGRGTWRPSYEKQRAHRRSQLDKMQLFTETTACRMTELVRHFGDVNDAGTPCGACDVCAPTACMATAFRDPSRSELAIAERVRAALAERDGRTIGQMHRELFEGIERAALEHVLGAMARSGEVRLVEDAFEKDGRTIRYLRAFLGAESGAPLRVVVPPAPPLKRRKKRRTKRRRSTSPRAPRAG